jgi:hypothetical protein
MPLTAQLLKSLMRYEPETGVFVRLAGGTGGAKPGMPCGFQRPNGYIDIKVKGRIYRAHRLAWFYMTGSWPTEQIDHINGQRDDNRWANLRDCSPTVNCQNRIRPRRGSRSGLIGASWCNTKKRWVATIGCDGRIHRLGAFRTAEAAHAEYLKAKRRLHPTAALSTPPTPERHP